MHGELPRPRALGYFVLAKTARALLAAGVTSVRDVGSYDDEAIVLREAVRLGVIEGPRILSCGRIISATAPVMARLGVTSTQFVVQYDTDQLSALVALVDKGVVRVDVTESHPLDSIANVHRKSEAGRIRGKVTVLPANT